MKDKKYKKIKENILYLFKWIIMCISVGILVSGIVGLFVFTLDKISTNTTKFKYYFLFLPLALFLSSFVIELHPNSSGTNGIIKELKKSKSTFNILGIPITFISTSITIAAGGSIGKAGPSSQMGSIGSFYLAKLFKLNAKETKTLVTCALAGVFSCILGGIFGGAIFASEVLKNNKIDFKHFLQYLCTAAVSYFLFSLFKFNTYGFDINLIKFSLVNQDISFILSNFSFSILASVFFSIIIVFVIVCLEYCKKTSNSINIYKPLKGIIGGVVLIVLTLSFGTNYLGFGGNYYSSLINGGNGLYYDFLLKILFTCITLSFGGGGGMVAPLVFIGTTAGYAFGAFLGLDTSLWASIGFLSVLAGATHTPLACAIVSLEIFKNPSLSLLIASTCFMTHYACLWCSIWPSQLNKKIIFKDYFSAYKYLKE